MPIRRFQLSALLFLAPVFALTQASAPALPAGASFSAHSKTPLDSGRAHVGDPVEAITSSDFKQDGATLLPKHSRLHGHVIAVTPAPSDHEAASLGVIFDQAVTPKGVTLPLRAGLAGVTSLSAPAAGGDVDESAPPPLPGNGGARPEAGAPTRMSMPAAANPAAVEASTGMRASNGVPLALVNATSPGGETAVVLLSQQGNLRIDSGAAIELRELDPAGHE